MIFRHFDDDNLFFDGFIEVLFTIIIFFFLKYFYPWKYGLKIYEVLQFAPIPL